MKTSTIATILVQSLFISVLLWFHHAGFYHNRFYESGLPVVGYQLARACFIAILVWVQYSVGYGAARLVAPVRLASLSLRDRIITGFLLGCCILHIVFFIAGLLGLYSKAAALSVAIALLLASIPHMLHFMRDIGARKHHVKGHGFYLLAIFGVASAFLLTKGLYPAGGHDYYNHYFHFYRAVVRDGIIQPNEVWYHFFYSKGATLYFFGMMLTDDLAPQLVTSGLVFLGSAIFYSLLRPSFKTPLMPYAGVFLFFLFLIYTPGPPLNQQHGGWGDLEKIHEITAMLFLGLFYCLRNGLSQNREDGRIWRITSYFLVACIALLNCFFSILVGIFIALLAGIMLIARKWQALRYVVCLGTCLGAAITTILIINYSYTGIIIDGNLIVKAWPWLNQKRIEDWGIMFELSMMHYNLFNMMHQPSPLTWDTPFYIASYLRLEIWWPLYLLVLLVLLARKGHVEKKWNSPIVMLYAAFIAMMIVFGLLREARSWPFSISAYRMSSFSYGIMLCLPFLLLGQFRFEWNPRRQAVVALIGFGVGVFCISALQNPNIVGGYVVNLAADARYRVSQIGLQALHLARGKYSLRDAYTHQVGWPGRQAFGGINPDLEEVYKVVPRGVRIQSFHINSYCMLPDCRVESWASYRQARNWQVVYFGAPEEARDALKSEGLDYFFISTATGMQTYLPTESALFKPENIAKYMAVRWHKDNAYLLTWPGKDTTPIDAKFIAGYKRQIAESGGSRSFPRAAFAQIARELKENPNPQRTIAMPWVPK
jgi:hypothetical protein